MHIALINQSTLVANADAERIALALGHQLRQAAHQWDRTRPTVEFGGDGDVQIVLLDDADQAGALGYHDVTPDGVPYARVFARDSIAGIAGVDPGSLTGEQPADLVYRCVAPVASHEALEVLGDELADDWAGPTADGAMWALELADPVESSSYPINVDGVDVLVSNYVLPSFFDVNTPVGAQVDEMAVVQTGPFTIAPDGYAIVDEEGRIGQVFGDELAGWRRAQHEAPHPASRTGRRMTTAAANPDTAGPDGDGASAAADLDPDAEPIGEPTAVAMTDEEEAELEATRVRHPASQQSPAHTQDNVSTPGVQITDYHDDREPSVHATDAEGVAVDEPAAEETAVE